MVNPIYNLLVKAGANKKYVTEAKISFDELGMMPAEKLYFFNLVEEQFDICIDDKEIPGIHTTDDVFLFLNRQTEMMLRA